MLTDKNPVFAPPVYLTMFVGLLVFVCLLIIKT